MTRLVRLALLALATTVIVAFSVVNRGVVEVSFFPLPLPSVELPVYAMLLIGLVVGTILGGATVWLAGLPMRREWRGLRARERARETEERLAREREEAEAAQRSLQRRETEDEMEQARALSR